MGENKVEFGLSNVHYAPYTVTGGVVTFETPIPIPGAVSMTSDPIGELTKFFADNMVYYVAKSNQGYDAKLNIATIPQQYAIDALGEEFDAENGVLNEIADAQGKPHALLFQFEGDVKATRHVLYNCTANRPSMSGQTKEAGTTISPNELSLTASPIELNGKVIVKTKTTSTTPTGVYDSWFTDVFNKVPDTTPPTVTVVPADAATAVAVDTDITWTFSEAIRDIDVTGANFFVTDESGAEVTGSLSLSADKTVVTFNPTASLTSLTGYTAMATKNVKDLASNALAQNSVTNFITA